MRDGPAPAAAAGCSRFPAYPSARGALSRALAEDPMLAITLLGLSGRELALIATVIILLVAGILSLMRRR